MTSKYSTLLSLPASSPGCIHQLRVIRYGAVGARPKVYLQAALHADEIPPLLVMQKLLERLDRADSAKHILGSLVLVPYANPIGYGQFVLGQLLGRFDLTTGANFNRDYPDLAAPLAARLADRLGEQAETNAALIRAAACDYLAQLTTATEVAELKRQLLCLAVDADIALDLHCDTEAVMHLYTGTPLWPAASDLAAWLGSQVILLAEASGGHPYDEALSAFWWQLAKQFPDKPIPAACLAATVELRGERDVDEAMAAEDADKLYRFLQGRGVLAGDPGPLPALSGEATPLDGVAHIKAPHAGVVSYCVPLGKPVAAGEIVAVLYDPSGERPRTSLVSPIDGVVFSRLGRRLVRPDEWLLKVAGKVSLPGRQGGLLLGD